MRIIINVCLFVSQNVTANHRASDAIVCEGRPQVLSGRFMYGPLDVVTLTGEKVTKVLILGLIYQDKWTGVGYNAGMNLSKEHYVL